MSYSLEESQIYHIFRFLVANAIFLGKDPCCPNSKVNVMKVFSLDIHLVARLIESTTKLMELWRKHMMLTLMNLMGVKMCKTSLVM
jgi:hypothetical protein